MDDLSTSNSSNSSMSTTLSSSTNRNTDSLDYILEEEEIEEEDKMFEITIVAILTTINQRLESYTRDRITWQEHIQELFDKGPTAFARMYRMKYESFNKLLKIIKPYLKTDQKMSMVWTGKTPITPEIYLHCLIWWLSGGSYLDIRLTGGISVLFFYKIIHNCIQAIMKVPELAYHFPTGYQEAANNFWSISSHKAITGCVACVDGYFLKLQTPAASETGNVKAYCSDHYQAYGINIQASCDYRCCFVSVCVAAPGSTNDIVAFRKTSLNCLVQNLPLGKYIIGDNAYVCSEHLLTPFAGAARQERKHDNYNFYVSQLQIQIKMAFGWMTEKWQILRKPLQTSLRNTGKVFLTITWLHNFCITEGDIDMTTSQDVDLQANGDNTCYNPSDLTITLVTGNSIMREIVVKHIFNKGLERPQN